MEKKKKGAKPKYSKPTTMVSFRCPENKVADFKKNVSLILKTYEVGKSTVPTMLNPPPPPKKEISKYTQKIVEVLRDNNSKEKVSVCDCYIDKLGLLRRGKIPCKKPKEWHRF